MKSVTVQQTIEMPLKICWHVWNHPDHIVNWYSASPDWHTPKASNEVVPGGEFCYRLAARDGSMAFDYRGSYAEVVVQEKLTFHLEDGRKVTVTFEKLDDVQTQITENFEPESINSIDIQRSGWQAILDHFKSYCEGLVD